MSEILSDAAEKPPLDLAFDEASRLVTSIWNEDLPQVLGDFLKEHADIMPLGADPQIDHTLLYRAALKSECLQVLLDLGADHDAASALKCPDISETILDNTQAEVAMSVADRIQIAIERTQGTIERCGEGEDDVLVVVARGIFKAYTQALDILNTHKVPTASPRAIPPVCQL